MEAPITAPAEYFPPLALYSRGSYNELLAADPISALLASISVDAASQ